MDRCAQGIILLLAVVASTVVVLAGALAWGPHHCAWAFPKVLGCALGSYEALAGGMIAGGAAVFAGWLAWSGVQAQIEAEDRRTRADRIEVEELLKSDVDYYAEGLAAIMKILAEPDLQEQLDAMDSGAHMIKKLTAAPDLKEQLDARPCGRI